MRPIAPMIPLTASIPLAVVTLAVSVVNVLATPWALGIVVAIPAGALFGYAATSMFFGLRYRAWQKRTR